MTPRDGTSVVALVALLWFGSGFALAQGWPYFAGGGGASALDENTSITGQLQVVQASDLDDDRRTSGIYFNPDVMSSEITGVLYGYEGNMVLRTNGGRNFYNHVDELILSDSSNINISPDVLIDPGLGTWRSINNGTTPNDAFIFEAESDQDRVMSWWAFDGEVAHVGNDGLFEGEGYGLDDCDGCLLDSSGSDSVELAAPNGAASMTASTSITFDVAGGTDEITVDDGVTNFGSPFRLFTEVAATPAAPFACTAAVLGALIYVDDTDDGQAGGLCLCGVGADDTTYTWIGDSCA